jgi:Coenzyme PQQ synthesis protein D (PqqD)
MTDAAVGSASTTSSFIRADEVLWRATRTYLALALPDGSNLAVTGPGARIWQLLASPASVEAIVEHLSVEFATPRHIVERDLTPVLSTLVDRGFVRAGD